MKNLLPISLAIALFVGAGCQRTEDVTPNPKDDVSKGARISATTIPTNECDVINFTNASGIISSVTSEDGVIVGVAGVNGDPDHVGKNAAMIFNSASPTGDDADLGTPNKYYSGPGLPLVNNSTNNTALGKLIIIQDFDASATVPNDADEDGSTLLFTFPSVVTATSIQVVDVEQNEAEGGTVALKNTSGTTIATFPIPYTGPNGVATINLGNTANVKKILITINGSMAFDNLRFCAPTTPPPPGEGCTRTQGYWKNHPNAWPVQSLTIGGTVYSKTTLINQVLKSPSEGNGVIILARQLIAAKLNVAKGAGASQEIMNAIAAADAKLTGVNITSGYIHPSQVSALATLLDQYNNGNKGTPKCK